MIKIQRVFNGTRMTRIERIITDGMLAQKFGCSLIDADQASGDFHRLLNAYYCEYSSYH